MGQLAVYRNRRPMGQLVAAVVLLLCLLPYHVDAIKCYTTTGEICDSPNSKHCFEYIMPPGPIVQYGCAEEHRLHLYQHDQNGKLLPLKEDAADQTWFKTQAACNAGSNGKCGKDNDAENAGSWDNYDYKSRFVCCCATDFCNDGVMMRRYVKNEGEGGQNKWENETETDRNFLSKIEPLHTENRLANDTCSYYECDAVNVMRSDPAIKPLIEAAPPASKMRRRRDDEAVTEEAGQPDAGSPEAGQPDTGDGGGGESVEETTMSAEEQLNAANRAYDERCAVGVGCPDSTTKVIIGGVVSTVVGLILGAGIGIGVAHVLVKPEGPPPILPVPAPAPGGGPATASSSASAAPSGGASAAPAK